MGKRTAQNQVHPKGNTDAHSTTAEEKQLPHNYVEGLSCSMDWFSTTFKDTTLEAVLDLLNLTREDLTEMEHGMHGYTEQYRYQNDVILLTGGKKNMGIHLVMSGNGCRIMENHQGFDWRAFISVCLTMQNKFPRVDAAVDEMRLKGNGFFTLEMIEKKLIEEQWVSYWKDAYVITHYKRGSKMDMNALETEFGLADLREELEQEEDRKAKTRRGKTIYFGSARSRVRARFYDKKEERLAKGHECDLETWNRAELQMRDVKAKEFLARWVIEGGEFGEQVAGHLMHYVRFVEPKKTEGNKYRWQTVQWWKDFCQHVARCAITMLKPSKTIEKTVTWLKRYVSAALAILDDLADSTDWVQMLIEAGKDKHKDPHRQMIALARESGTDVMELLRAA